MIQNKFITNQEKIRIAERIRQEIARLTGNQDSRVRELSASGTITAHREMSSEDLPTMHESNLVAQGLSAIDTHHLKLMLKNQERIKTDPDFGICGFEGCGNPIPFARFNAVPWAQRCCECESRIETPVNAVRSKVPHFIKNNRSYYRPTNRH
jgi:RNA polymerase-binding transcription factor DksA